MATASNNIIPMLIVATYYYIVFSRYHLSTHETLTAIKNAFVKNTIIHVMEAYGIVCLIMCSEATNMTGDDDVTGTVDIPGLPKVDDVTGTDDKHEVLNDNLNR